MPEVARVYGSVELAKSAIAGLVVRVLRRHGACRPVKLTLFASTCPALTVFASATALLCTVLTATSTFAAGGSGGLSTGFGGSGGADNTGVGGVGQAGNVTRFPLGMSGGGGGGAGATGGDGGDGANRTGANGLHGNGGLFGVSDPTNGLNGGQNGNAGNLATTGGGGGGGGAHGSVGPAFPTSSRTGGRGGDGGDGGALGGGGGGGAGGYGAVVTGSGSFVLGAGVNVTGGFGGNGGNAGAANLGNGGGGSGGVGLYFTDTTSSKIVTVDGKVNGGNGGSSGAMGQNGVSGQGGAGVVGGSLTVILDANGQITGGLSGNGTARADAVSFRAGGPNVFQLNAPLSGATAITGNVVAASTADTLRLGGSAGGSFDVTKVDNNSPAQDIFRGFGILEIAGSATWTLTGTTNFAGNTVVNAGTALVNGNLATSSGVTVNNGGTLSGTGTVATTTIASGGTLAPGNSIGTLNVAGNLTFSPGATYNVEISPSASDRTNVTGTAALNGATVATSFSAGSYVAKQYAIVNASGGLIGTFGALINSNLPANFATTLSYDTNNAYLNIALTFPPGSFGGLDQNQQNVANALSNYFNSIGGIPLVYGLLTPGGLTQVSGEPGASIPQAGFAAMNQFINAMMDNTGGNRGQGGPLGFADADDNPLNAYAAKRKRPPAYAAVTPRDRMAAPFASRWNVWATSYGGNSTISGDTAAGSHATSTRVYGTVVGTDYRATADTRFGFALGGAGNTFSVDSALGGGRADVFQAGAYARHTMGAVYVAGAAAYAWQDITTGRTVTASGTDKLHAQLKANAMSARIEGGLRYAMLPVAMMPYAAAQTTAFYLPSYGETATSGSNQFALSYRSKTVTATRAELGAKFDKAIPVNDALLTLRGRAAWAHDWNTDRSAIATLQSLPAATFTVKGAQPSANAVLLSLGCEMAWPNGWSLGVQFNGELSSLSTTYIGAGTAKYMW